MATFVTPPRKRQRNNNHHTINRHMYFDSSAIAVSVFVADLSLGICWCGFADSTCFALLPGPVSDPPGPRSVLRVRCFPIRCFPLFPVASRAGKYLSGSPIRGADPLLPDPLLPAASSCTDIGRLGPLCQQCEIVTACRMLCNAIFNLNSIVSRYNGSNSRMS